MKKCGILILSLIIITFYSCSGITQTDDSAKEMRVQPCDTVYVINDTVLLDSNVKDSPKLTVNMALAGIQLKDSAATEKTIKDISYALTGKEYCSLSEAGKEYLTKLRNDYIELRPEYMNIGADNGIPHWFNHEFSVDSRCHVGYKGFVNYILNINEYTGGAHPNSYCIALTFDYNDGHEVTIGEIMKENYEEPLLELITQSIMSFLKVENTEELDRIIFDHKELYISKNVVMDKESIRFIYNKYDIAPYAVGEIVAEIPYEKLKHILK